MYYVTSAKSGRVLSGSFDSKEKALAYLLELESQDMSAGIYIFNSYDIKELT
jgi:hypothetical protein